MPRHDITERTKSEILKTAGYLFREKGWDKVTIEDIVKEVGVTRGAFYHYFKSREELIYAVFTQSLIGGNIFALTSERKDINSLEKIRLIHKHALQLEINVAMESDMQKTMYDPVVYKSNIFTFMKIMAPYIEKLIIEGNNDGSTSVEYPKHMAQAMILICDEWINPAVYQMTEQEFRDRLSFLELFLGHMGVPILDDELREMLITNYNLCKK